VNTSGVQCSGDLYAESTIIQSGHAHLCGQDGESGSPCCQGDCDYVDTFTVFGVDWNYPKDEFTDLQISTSGSIQQFVYPWGHMSAVRDNNRKLYTCGNNCYGMLGLGDRDGRLTHEEVTNLPDIIDVKINFRGFSVLTTSNKIYYTNAYRVTSNYFEDSGIELPASEMIDVRDWMSTTNGSIYYSKADGTLWWVNIEDPTNHLPVEKDTEYYSDYWVVPETNLTQAPTEVYKLPEILVNEVKLIPTTITLANNLIQFDDVTFSAETRILTTVVNFENSHIIFNIKFTPIKN
jgi:hypothetical protein